MPHIWFSSPAFEAVTEIDLSCLQLLCSAHRTALSLNKNLTLNCQESEAFMRPPKRNSIIESFIAPMISNRRSQEDKAMSSRPRLGVILGKRILLVMLAWKIDNHYRELFATVNPDGKGLAVFVSVVCVRLQCALRHTLVIPIPGLTVVYAKILYRYVT